MFAEEGVKVRLSTGRRDSLRRRNRLTRTPQIACPMKGDVKGAPRLCWPTRSLSASPVLHGANDCRSHPLVPPCATGVARCLPLVAYSVCRPWSYLRLCGLWLSPVVRGGIRLGSALALCAGPQVIRILALVSFAVGRSVHAARGRHKSQWSERRARPC